MPATTVPFLRLTDGFTTLDLVDGTNYAIERGTWAPSVAPRRRSTLGGRQYESVVEEIPLIVRGSTAATALANLAALSAMLDQAERWYQDENVLPVRVQYQPHGSVLTAPLESLVLGRADGGFSLPPTMNDVGMLFEIHGVVLRFVRDGAWHEEEEETITGMTLTHPEIAWATFLAGDADLPSPVKVVLGGLPDVLGIDGYDTGFLLIANDRSRLALIDAYDMALSDFTTDADASRHPEGSGVLVYTPPDTAEHNSGGESLIGFGSARYIGVIAALRNTHATTEFTVRVTVNGVSTLPYIVDTSTTDPRIVSLGVVLVEGTGFGAVIYATASAAAGTLVFDYLAFINLDDPTSRIIAIGPTPIISPVSIQLTVDPRAVEDRSPVVQFQNAAVPTQFWLPTWYRGDAYLLSDGDEVAALACLRNLNGGFWTPWDTVTAAPIDADFTFTRRIARLAPI